MASRSAYALAREMDAHERLMESMRERAPRAQALREEVGALLEPFPPGTWKVLEMALIELATMADAGHEVRPEVVDDVHALMAEVR